MKKSILVVIHGMGRHTAEDIKNTVIKAGNIALQRYEKYKNEKFEDYVDVKGIGYDHFFEEERKRIVDSNKPVSEYFKAAKNLPDLFIENIVELESEIGDDSFYTTHALDVLLYAGLLVEQVRLSCLKDLCGYMADKGDSTFHVLAHSLGTAVVHDTLHKAFTGGIKDDDGKSYALNPVTHKLDSLWMVSNVSRLMYALNPMRTTPDPKNTVVKPSTGSAGCAHHFYNIRHVLDPFTKFYPFDPQPGDSWLFPDDYDDYYHNIISQKIGEFISPHDLSGFLIDPLISYRFLKRVMPAGMFNPSREDVTKAHQGVRNLVGELKKITEYVNQISTIRDFKAFLKMAKEYQAYIQLLKGQATSGTEGEI